jgi:dienelactone hydrolase
VLDMARHAWNVRAVVSLHGGLDPLDDTSAPTISAGVLVLHGYDDPIAPPEKVINFIYLATAISLNVFTADSGADGGTAASRLSRLPVARVRSRSAQLHPPARRSGRAERL